MATSPRNRRAIPKEGERVDQWTARLCGDLIDFARAVNPSVGPRTDAHWRTLFATWGKQKRERPWAS